MKADQCIFCKIANGEIPAKTLYEDDKFRVILDQGPATRGHALILPKDHYADLFELPEETAGEVMKLAKRMMAKMREKLGCEGFNLVQNNGDLAGQTVFHFHLHLIPRYSADGQKIGWKPQEVTPEELEKVRAQFVDETCGADRRIRAGKTDSGPAAGKSGDCREGDDSDLPGYGNGRGISGNRAGCTLGGRRSDGCGQ